MDSPKIHLSPAAQAVGSALMRITVGQTEPTTWVALGDLADATSLMPDTCYRAVRELADLGAIEPTERRDHLVAVSIVSSHWVWTALLQILVENGAW